VTRLAALLPVALAACAQNHIAPYVPRQREYRVPDDAAPRRAPESDGSLWADGAPGTMLFADARALRVDDLVVVRVEESADARRSAGTDLSRATAHSAALSAFLKLNGRALVDSPEGGLKTETGRTFRGEGSSDRSESLSATVPALVRKVLPNGNLFIEGHRVVLVNREEHHFYISGVVRPVDIDQDNSVRSSAIADAEIEFTGRGDLSENQHQGILSRLGWLCPF